MDTPPPRLIAHIFAEQFPSSKVRARMREQLEQVCAKEGSRLVDLIFDHERADRQPGDYPSLVRIAAGEADGLMLARMPMSMEARPTADLLCSALNPPLCMFDKVALESRGLLPKPATQRRSVPSRGVRKQKAQQQQRATGKAALRRKSGQISTYDRSPTPDRF